MINTDKISAALSLAELAVSDLKQQANYESSEAKDARDIIAAALDRADMTAPIGLKECAEEASLLISELIGPDAKYKQIIEVAREVSARDTAKIAELEAHLKSANEEKAKAQRELERITLDFRNACEVGMRSEVRVVELLNVDRNLSVIETMLESARVTIDDDEPAKDEHDPMTIRLVRALIDQRNWLGSELVKVIADNEWMREVTAQRDKIIADEYTANMTRYTKADGSRMSELEILPAIIKERDDAVAAYVRGRIEQVAFEKAMSVTPEISAVNRDGDVIAQASPDLTTTIMLDDAARALGWRTDWACGDSPVTWKLVLEQIARDHVDVAALNAKLKDLDAALVRLWNEHGR